MKKECKVVMLPTEKASTLWYNKDTKQLVYNPDYYLDPTHVDIPQHLYLISDDEIRENDWFIKWSGGKWNLHQCSEFDKKLIDELWNETTYKKVIASTDLLQITVGKDGDDILVDCLPKFSESFIKAYVKANGEIDKVEVEYEQKADMVIGQKSRGITNLHWALKLTPNNEVIISMVEEKMYNKDEVVELLMKASKDRAIQHREGFNKWIEENL